MKFLCCATAITLLLFSGCGNEEESTVIKQNQSGLESTPSALPERQNSYTVLTEVDMHIRPVATLAQDSEQIECKLLRTERGYVSIGSATVKQPVPKKIKGQFYFEIFASFEKKPVLVRAEVYRDKEVLEKFAFIATKPSEEPVEGQSCELNILEGLDTIPDTMLLLVRAEALLIPVDTDLSSINMETYTVPETERTQLISNPLRIDFEKE